MGFVLLITVLDKHRSAGVGGVSERLEKEGLKRFQVYTYMYIHARRG